MSSKGTLGIVLSRIEPWKHLLQVWVSRTLVASLSKSSKRRACSWNGLAVCYMLYMQYQGAFSITVSAEWKGYICQWRIVSNVWLDQASCDRVSRKAEANPKRWRTEWGRTSHGQWIIAPWTWGRTTRTKERVADNKTYYTKQATSRKVLDS
jgi:hypothetical protein